MNLNDYQKEDDNLEFDHSVLYENENIESINFFNINFELMNENKINTQYTSKEENTNSNQNNTIKDIFINENENNEKQIFINNQVNNNSDINIRRTKNKIKNIKNMGRKRYSNKESEKMSKHTKYSGDNAAYHIKVMFQKFIVEFIEYYSEEYNMGMKLKKLCGKGLKKGDKIYNITLFNKTIEEILKSKISSKFTNNKENTNIQLIDKLKEKSDIVKTFCSKTYKDCFNYYYLMESDAFNEDYYVSKHLFKNTIFKKEKDKEFYSKFIEDFFNYFDRKIPRRTINDD